jgi:hypothetical protein
MPHGSPRARGEVKEGGDGDGVSKVEWRSAGEVTEAEDGADGGGRWRRWIEI